MAASVFDSQHLGKLFHSGELAALFTDSAEMRALLLVEGALAKVQGDLGIIPQASGSFLHRAAMEVQVDPGGLAEATQANGVCIPAFVAALRKTLEAPEHAQYLHWGATSQDILDTALMLRLKRAFEHLSIHLKHHLNNIAENSDKYAETVIAGRTWGQQATPSSFGALNAAWGRPLLALYHEFEAHKAQAFWVSLSGAAGTSGALGPKAAHTRAALAKALGLHDPATSWHSDRTPLTWLAAWATRLANALAKMGADLTELNMTELGEVTFTGAGSSSTMPQKQNPVAAATITALAAHATALNSVLQGAAVHKHQRDGAAWMSEWLALPQLVLGTGAALHHAEHLSRGLVANSARMEDNLARSQELIYAEALSFALAAQMPRPEAQAQTKELCKTAQATGRPLSAVAAEAFEQLDLSAVFAPAAQLGEAPAEARRFAADVRALP
ncbi:lyase family protein [uncultured Lentibacter sp.]|uniref:lyase family protein n=1 Tax=uncultured Lentibacter sp. TaxID=1659309 RepID=UPI00260D6A7D|nr:lyase family protein [uncultured Lentibacter sp.]